MARISTYLVIIIILFPYTIYSYSYIANGELSMALLLACFKTLVIGKMNTLFCGATLPSLRHIRTYRAITERVNLSEIYYKCIS